jgi:hypothetical protein
LPPTSLLLSKSELFAVGLRFALEGSSAALTLHFGKEAQIFPALLWQGKDFKNLWFLTSAFRLLLLLHVKGIQNLRFAQSAQNGVFLKKEKILHVCAFEKAQ